MFIWQISKKYMLYIFFIIALTSFIYGEYVLSYKNPDSAFYLIPGRLWELVVGSLIAIYLFHHQKRFDLFIKRFPFASELLGLIGLGFIIYAVLFFDDAMLFPGLNAAMPILGATLIILFARPGFLTTRILTLKPFVWIGLISYSAYLWHQPLMAFTRNISINEPSIFLFLTLAFLSLILGYLSWRYVETPFRSYKAISRRYFFLTIGLLSSLLVIFAYIGFKNEGYPYRVHSYNNPHFQKDNSLSLFETMKLYIGTKPNHAPKNDQQKPKEINVPDIFLNDPNIEINYFGDLTSHDIYVLYGDSHAGVFEESLDQPFKKFKIKGMRIKINHCHPVPEVINAKHNSDMMRSYQTCKASFGNLIQFVKDGAKGVILSSRWTIKLYPLDQINEKQPFDNGEGGVELDWRPEKFMVLDSKHHFTFDRKNKAEVLKDFIYRFDETGKPILLIYPIPEVGWNIPRINFQNYILGRDKLTRDISTSYERFKSRNAFVNNVFDGLNLRHVIRIKPENILCNSFIKDRCVAQMNGVMFYSDDDHLSLEGAKLVSDDMIKKYHF
jgi:hypothetical protein